MGKLLGSRLVPMLSEEENTRCVQLECCDETERNVASWMGFVVDRCWGTVGGGKLCNIFVKIDLGY